MSDLSSSIVTILAVDFLFAAVTGMTGIHGAIVGLGEQAGEILGIPPIFGAESIGEVPATDGSVAGAETGHEGHNHHNHAPGEVCDHGSGAHAPAAPGESKNAFQEMLRRKREASGMLAPAPAI